MAAVEEKLFGTDLFGQPMKSERKQGALNQKFIIPPFTVLNTREGVWQERRRAWLDLGIKSEIGRGGDVLGLQQVNEAKAEYDAKAKGVTIPAGLTFGQFSGDITGPKGGTSIFDPVLCECVYRWFCPPGGTVFDTFAGGSVRGVVAGMMGLQYFGIDLRQEQVDANNAQAVEIVKGEGVKVPRYFCGDSLVLAPKAGPCDLFWSCPPYADLERYSDDPRDLSTMEYDKFLEAYVAIIAHGVAKLKQDRFAAFVVGDVRDKRGMYRNFVGHTVQAFRKAGAEYYNEAVLINACGTMPVRMTRQFIGGRKMGKVHQNLLVFCKGDPKTAATACRQQGEVIEKDEAGEDDGKDLAA